MLYPRSCDKTPDPELFRNPPSEYRGAPFWAWNCDLEEDTLRKEIEVMQKMGMGGFHMHTRVGMSLKYLSDDFMGKVRFCAEEARKRHMLAWLYDEDKWPSGFAGGYVTEKEENRQRFLLFTPRKPGEGKLLARYEIVLDEAGRLSSYRRLEEGEQGAGRIWYAAEQITRPSPWFHFNGYVDTMSPPAIRDFIRVTHERYLEALGKDVGTLCPAIFTDEPQMPRKTTLSRSTDLQDVILPWTGDLEESYARAWGESLLDHLPEVIWEKPEGISLTRYRFHDHTAERFVSAFCDQIGSWCRAHGILMTGHMMEEGSLESQTRAVGEVMRAYRAFTLPGVDQLCDGREFLTVKQAASAAHQQGCPGVTSEMYGVTNWDFDFKGHKLQGDWQAALGVTVRVHHLYWCSMHGESKRDYPASIGHQSPWWKEYPYIEDHFARVNALMTRGKPLIRVGVIHPVESCWIAFGPNDLTGRKRAELDRKFDELTRWLLNDTLDFDYICESTLPSLYRPGDAEERGGAEAAFRVGEMAYDAVVVPACETLRRTTLDALRAFRNNGGRVVFLDSVPKYVDALPSEDAKAFAEECEYIPWDREELNRSLAPCREIRILNRRGAPAEGLLCALRRDGDCRNLFLAHAWRRKNGAPDKSEEYTLELKGLWTAELYDTLTGEIRPYPADRGAGVTTLSWTCWEQDSLLLRLTPALSSAGEISARESAVNGSYGIHMSEDFSLAVEPPTETFLPPPEEVIPEEDNALLLDTARWRVDGGAWQEEEDMLRIGVKAKERLGISTAAVSGAQPWVLPPEKPEHTLFLRISFRSEIALPSARLALEDADECEILFNGETVDKTKDGFYTDESISCLRVGPVRAGINTLEVTKPIAAATAVENMFLLGNFGVTVAGADKRVVPAPKTFFWGDWTQQGFPFYSGKMTYRCRVTGGRRLKLRLGRFAAPCVTLEADGKRAANLSLAPSEADLGYLEEGEHILDISVFSSRINSFGTLHLNDPSVVWYGPEAWRSTGMRWTKNYVLAPSGLLSEPHLFEYR